jgi:integrase
MNLTDNLIASLIKAPPASGRAEYTDVKLNGLTLRVTANGAATWSFRYRSNGRPTQRVNLGPVSALNVAAARAKAKTLIGGVASGADPAALRRAQIGALLFSTVADRYIEEYASQRKSSWKNDQGYLKRVKAAWTHRSAESITRSDVVALLEQIRATAPVSANRTRSVLVTLFGWALECGLVGSNPASGVKARSKETARDRVLSPDEISAFWRMTGQSNSLDPNVAAALRCILLTGQRPGEVAGIVDAEVRDMDDPANARIEFPAARMKARKAHVLPLAPLAAELIRDGLSRNIGSGAPFASAFASRATLARHSLSQALRRIGVDFTPHDLRRTALTGLAALGIPREDRLAVAAHVGGDTHAQHYDKYMRLPEKRAALQAWELRLSQMVA